MTASNGLQPPSIQVVTLGVSDLERSLRFYRDGLGLPTKGVVGSEFPGDAESAAGDAVMFELPGGLILSLYPFPELAKDAGSAVAEGGGAMSIGHIVGSREEVDRVLRLAGDAGAHVISAAHERPWGIYSGYFADPDNHLWEVMCLLERENPVP